jgi:hypothetical protein
VIKNIFTGNVAADDRTEYHPILFKTEFFEIFDTEEGAKPRRYIALTGNSLGASWHIGQIIPKM